ncbi:MAG TPA: patatin-like phospholipase family protein, partial [Thermoanaerobaculia bacterium]
MIELASDLPLLVDFAADPFVIELADHPRRTVDLRFEVEGVPPGAELAIEVPAIPPSDGFRFEVDGRIRQHRHAHGATDHEAKRREPSHGTIEVTVPVCCTTDGDRRGREAATTLTVRLRLVGEGGESSSADFSAGVIAAAARRLPFSEVLRDELVELVEDPEWRAELARDPVLDDPTVAEDDKVAHLYGRIHERGGGLSALCFSGGGIRSATFNLGVLQGLADAGILQRFDYLSSVSGGGYISSWLAGWVHRARGIAPVLPNLRTGNVDDPVTPETWPIRFLRSYSNYLTPRLGALSPDTWTLVAIVVRNLLLNWLVILPLLAAVLALPLLAIASGGPRAPALVPVLYGAGLLIGGVGVFFMSALRASTLQTAKGRESAWHQRFLRWGLVPVLAGTMLLAWAAAAWIGTDGVGPSFGAALSWSVPWAVGVPIVAFLLAEPLRRRLERLPQRTILRDVAALAVAGGAVSLVYAGVLTGWAPGLLASPYFLYPLLAPVLFLGPMLLGKTLFVAFAGVAEGDGAVSADGDAEREWWARWSSWTLISMVVWLAAAAIAFYAPSILDTAAERVAAAIGAGGLGGLVSRLGKSADGGGKIKDVALALAAPLFVVALLLIVAAASQALFAVALPAEGGAPAGADVAEAAPLDVQWVPPYQGAWWHVLLAIAGLAGFGLVLGRFVDVNRFSLQAMYRNRLVRAYLGGTNGRRRPNPFTGFDPGDDLPLHRLRSNRPWPVINIALNLVAGDQLAWQERKAESFTATPLHCGSARLGYRRSQVYGGEGGLSLGTAVATSGAAASPNMGYHSSPAISFIMALFNARLGAWLGNPGAAGSSTYTRSGPAQSAFLLLAEALGQTDDHEPYVYLSDGGHFENLGLYEMVRRRCQVVVVCDAGCDPTCRFDDLGNVIRKVRIDLGVPIDFPGRIRIYPKPADKPTAGAAYCAVGRIDYATVDGPRAQPGYLLYVKPAIVEGEPYDVTNYAKKSKDFPHEPTADQWFSESQFESYRALGRSAIATILGTASGAAPLAGL